MIDYAKINEATEQTRLEVRRIIMAEGAAAERARIVADEAEIERVVKSDFMVYCVYGGYNQEAKESEWSRMRNIELNTFKRRLHSLLDRGDHAKLPPREEDEHESI